MVGIRRAIALLFLGFYVTQFTMTAFLGPDELFACYLGLALCYLAAFFGLAAEWFWARWFAMGVGNFGSLLLLVLFKVGMEPIIAFVGGTHLLITLCLMGEGMAAKYEHSERTAERWGFQEESMALMRRAIKSAGSTLPFLILYGLAPREEMMGINYLAFGLGALGVFAIVRQRTWGLFALGGAGAIALADGLGFFGERTLGYLALQPDMTPTLYGPFGIAAGALMIIPLLFWKPLARWMRA